MQRLGIFALLACCIFSFITCAGPTQLRNPTPGKSYKTVASWYGKPFHGRRTASGEVYNMYAMTAAHKHLPFGTRLHVTNQKNGRAVVVTVNDRGPFVRGRHLDLSYASAKKIGLLPEGVGWVKVKVIGTDNRYKKYLAKGVLPGNSSAKMKDPEKFTIQFGAFQNRKNALRLKKGLDFTARGAYIAETVVKGRRFYQVRLGSYSTKSAAQNRARSFAEEGYSVIIARR